MGHCCTTGRGHDDEDDEEDHHEEIAGGNIHLITTMANWEAKLTESIKDEKIVVVNFSAPWCVPCKKIAPDYIEIADKYPSIICLTVDVDELPEFSNSWGIKATPTFFFLKEGRQVDKLIGANKFELERKAAAATNLTTKTCN
ncbi:hypothetical protein Ddye_032018 [Dipteronia dyeriana]|uniref:Thioredoxin domain-containing protein n=1 Tax=Dipteronia dyeriana TaxID=168575 RepID=A0AAD9TJM7_9ROSI|nr:hypothetical protein Ddye_032018 [Dipteronia dyeriana]